MRARPKHQFIWIGFLIWLLSPSIGRAADNISGAVQQRKSLSGSPEQDIFQNSRDLPKNFEDRLAELFSLGECESINQYAKPAVYEKVRPFVLAVLASCRPLGQSPQLLFEKALIKEPRNELILLLYGRYLWKTDPKQSMGVWEKLKFTTKNRALSQLADDYLSGDGEALSKDAGLSTLSTYQAVQIGPSYEQNPTLHGLSSPGGYASAPSAALNASTFASIQKLTSWGSVSGSYAFTANLYKSTPGVNLLEHDSDLPIMYRVSPAQDIAIRPFGSLVALGGNPYLNLYGVGILDYLTFATWKQYIQIAYYKDQFSDKLNQPQAGEHFRFEYKYDSYQPQYFSGALAYGEHIDAGVDTMCGTCIAVPFSHTDFGIQTFFDYDVIEKKVSVGFYPRIIYRLDKDPSLYITTLGGPIASKTREDVIVSLQPNISVDLGSGFSVFAWYEYDQSMSSMGADSYLDRNTINQIFGVSLRYLRASF